MSLASVSAMPSSSAINPVDVTGQYGDASYTETRKVSSVVVESQVLGEIPQQDTVRYVEVPTIEEKIKYVTKVEIREVERRVPKYEYEWVERIVETPVIVEKKREVEVPQIVEKIVEKRVKQIVERPVEVLKEVHRPKVVTKEKIVEVPGETIEVPKPYTVEVPVEVPHFMDKRVPVIVSQTVKPVIVEGGDSIVVDVLDYEPEVIPVDVHVARPVSSALKFVGQTDAKHRVVNVSAAQYNGILRQLNSHMDEKMNSQLPYVSENNSVPFAHDVHFIVAPDNVWHEDDKTMAQSKSRGAEASAIHEVSVEHFSTMDPKKKSRACCNASPKSTDMKVVQRSAQGSHISVRSASPHQEVYYKATDPSISTQPHTVQTNPKETASSATSYTTGHGSSVTTTTEKRHETSIVSFGPQTQTKQRVCC